MPSIGTIEQVAIEDVGGTVLFRGRCRIVVRDEVWGSQGVPPEQAEPVGEICGFPVQVSRALPQGRIYFINPAEATETPSLSKASKRQEAWERMMEMAEELKRIREEGRVNRVGFFKPVYAHSCDTAIPEPFRGTCEYCSVFSNIYDLELVESAFVPGQHTFYCMECVASLRRRKEGALQKEEKGT